MAEIFIDSHALCESSEIGPGTRIQAFAHVMQGAVIGSDCNIGDHAFVEAGARIGDRVTIKNQVVISNGFEIADDVFVGPGACFTNDPAPRGLCMPLPPTARHGREKREWPPSTRVERGASLGARCVVFAGITIGAYAMVAAGAVVTRNVSPHALVAGMPAQTRGWVCRCGARLRLREDAIWRCTRCAEAFVKRTRGSTSLAVSY